jgi:hypothetical protein
MAAFQAGTFPVAPHGAAAPGPRPSLNLLGFRKLSRDKAASLL